MKVQGWIAFVPETVSLAFLPAERDCIVGELLEWQLLTIGQNMQLFTSEFEPKIESLGECRCYFVDSEYDILESWFSNLCWESDTDEDEAA